MPMVRIGEALIGAGLHQRAQLEVALSSSARTCSVPVLLRAERLASRADLQTALR